MTPELSIIVPVYNQADLTKQCFSSILMHTRSAFELIWVDNGSLSTAFNEIKDYVVTHGINCKVVVNPDNTGFIKATNQGIRLAQGRYVILLNNDTIVMPNWDTELLKPLIRFPHVGAVGPITQNSTWQYPEEINRIFNLDLPPYTSLSADFFHRLNKFKDQYIDITPRPLYFFCVAMRKTLFDEIGYLCEDLFIGLGDDDDLCNRICKKNYRLLLSLGTFIYHVHRATFNAMMIDVASLSKHNMRILREKARAEKIETKPNGQV